MGSALCRNCGQPLRAGIRVCTQCGTEITPSQDLAQQIPERAPTEPLGTTSDRRVISLGSRQVVVLSIITALLIVGAIAAGALTAPEQEPSGQLVAQLPFDSDGGTKAFDGGAGKIKVPKGALDGPATIEVRRRPLRQRVTASSPTGQTLSFPAGALVVYFFGPTTLTFNRPVTIVFTLPVAGQSGLIFVTDAGQLRFYTGTVGDGTITIQLNSFDLSQPNAIIRTST